MKLSELIAELQEIYEENGDLPVFTRNDEFGVYQEMHGAVLDVFDLTEEEQQWGDVSDQISPGDSLVCL